uniref:FlgD Ig-like domain-containing protein n=1 Tax=Eiseniibacteriota bacterium TaxID=2212470 RepID=A0A832I6X4_UNCEI
MTTFVRLGRLRATLAHVALAALLGLLVHGPAAANELGAGGRPTGLVFHGPEETLAKFCARDTDGRLWLELPGGLRFELVTSVDDPAISNPGDGAFFPFDVAEVRAALAGVAFPLSDLRADVFVLPYPRRTSLESAAGPGLILLSPGTRRIAREQQHAEFVHELGHVVQYQMLPDADGGRWAQYRALRGIADPAYGPSSPHADRPHEIFAEDFRALFGGALARYSGTIENAELAHPEQVPGLAEFMWSLAERGPSQLAFEAWPNPSRGAVRFARSGGAAVPVDVFDATGRRIATLAPVALGAVTYWSWNGLGADGRPAPPGVLFARPREPGAAAARIVVAR